MSVINYKFLPAHIPIFSLPLPEPGTIYTPFTCSVSHIKASWALAEMYRLGQQDIDIAEFNGFKEFVIYVERYPSVYRTFLQVVAGLQAQYTPMRDMIKDMRSVGYKQHDIQRVPNTIIDLSELLWFLPTTINNGPLLSWMVNAQNAKTAQEVTNVLGYIKGYFNVAPVIAQPLALVCSEDEKKLVRERVQEVRALLLASAC